MVSNWGNLLGRMPSRRQGARGQNRGPRVKGPRLGEGGWSALGTISCTRTTHLDGLTNGHVSLLGLPRPPILAGIATWPSCWWWWSRWGLCAACVRASVGEVWFQTTSNSVQTETKLEVWFAVWEIGSVWFAVWFRFGKRVGFVNGFKLGLNRFYFLFGLGCKLVFQTDFNWFKLVQTVSNCFNTVSN